ncbi:MAG: glycosyltransferase [Planctomycetota bacterium]|nr:glycosyltransferase [Planctomycetota bacterium]
MIGREVDATIIVPCYRAEPTLRACLTALAAQEGVSAYEVIVVENGSDDGSLAIAEAAAEAHPGVVRVIHEPRPGAYAARNRGLSVALGVFVLFTDADCRPSPGWLARMLEELRDATVLMVGGEVLADSGQESLVARYSARENVLSQAHTLRHPRGPFLQTANLGVRLADARAVGFDDALYSGGDADFCWRLRKHRPHGALRLVGGAVVYHAHRETLRDLYRQYRRYGQSDVLLAKKHGVSLSHTVVKLIVDLLRVLLAPVLVVLRIPFALVAGDPVIALSPLLRAVRVLGRRWGQLQAIFARRSLHRA